MIENKDYFSKYKGKYYDSIKEAVRDKCLDCSGDDKTEVRECTVYSCPLYMFRMYNKNNRTLENGFKFKK